MPEYILPIDNIADWNALDYITQGFIEAMFFTEQCPQTDAEDWNDPDVQSRLTEGQLDGTIPSDMGTGSIEPDSLKKIAEFCTKWEAANKALYDLAADVTGYDEKRIGNDLFYNHVGHGVGFWSRDELDVPCPQGAGRTLGEMLSEAAGRGEVMPYFNPETQTVSVDLY